MTKEDTSPSPLEDKIIELETALLEAQTQVETEKEKALRALADLQNFQRREAEMKAKWSDMAVSDFLKKGIKKMLELSLASTHTEDEDMKKVIESFFKNLAEQGLTALNPEAGADINPDEHEVLMTEEGDAGKIVRVLEPGWKYNEIVIQPAKVSAALQ